MEYNYTTANHHSSQNAVGEVDIPEPHQPGCKPPAIKKSDDEEIAQKEEQETFFISLYPTGQEMVQVQTDTNNPQTPNQTTSDESNRTLTE